MSFEVKISLTFLCAGIVYYIMMRIQTRKEIEAERQYQLTMKMLEYKASQREKHAKQANKKVSDIRCPVVYKKK